MNFYSHHIGDFNNATRHLSRLERSIYRDLLELYYDTEKPLTTDFDKLARRCLVADDERGAMRDVLNEFFELTDDGYRNKRADREIAAYQRMGEGGKRGAAKRWGNGGDSPPIATPLPPKAKANANHEPVTNNHKPVIGDAKRRKQLPADFCPDATGIAAIERTGLSLAVELPKFSDYHRAKGSVMLDWQAAWRTWVSNATKFAPRSAVVQALTVPSRPGRDPELERLERDRQKAVGPPLAVLEHMAKIKQGVKA